MIHVLIIDIYESKPYPVVRHEFRGTTRQEAIRYYYAHQNTDAFLTACVNRQRFAAATGKVDCRAVTSWREEE